MNNITSDSNIGLEKVLLSFASDIGVEQEDLASISKVSRQTLASWASGKQAKDKTLGKVICALEFTLDNFDRIARGFHSTQLDPGSLAVSFSISKARERLVTILRAIGEGRESV